ncbi:MAG: N-acetylmuramoyl-L-alanine amidase [Kiritimatiellae bacterium]|nr:N-acetylmuramoyl-L-alanine amidase [Kiritimatiellia bacterium]
MRTALVLALLLAASDAAAIDASNRYRSPRNPERAIRRSTELIVLHTTEAPAKSSLNKLSDRGEAHFCVTEEGSVYRIVDRDREAFHAGRSMWNGKEDVDKFSIGIECVGYHDKPMSSVQLGAIRQLVKELQSMYRIPDERVVCHSHVAYGAPNKWHKRAHRGRKRCGMLFAMPSVRKVLGLSARPKTDQDVKARRLVVGDDYLNKVLYGSVDTMAGKVAGPRNSPGTNTKTEEKPNPILERIKSAVQTKPAQDGQSPAAQPKPAEPAARQQPKLQSPKPQPPKPQPPKPQAPKSIADLKRMGYVERGKISRESTASRIAGKQWNSPDTWYTIRDKIFPGDKIDPRKLENGMSVWTKK